MGDGNVGGGNELPPITSVEAESPAKQLSLADILEPLANANPAEAAKIITTGISTREFQVMDPNKVIAGTIAGQYLDFRTGALQEAPDTVPAQRLSPEEVQEFIGYVDSILPPEVIARLRKKYPASPIAHDVAGTDNEHGETEF